MENKENFTEIYGTGCAGRRGNVPKNQTTIYDIAKDANVSAATVSRVLNNSSKVFPETFERVQQSIKKLDYQPNLMSRSLAKKDNRNILIVLPNIANPFYADIVMGMIEISRLNKYEPLISITDLRADMELHCMDMISNNQASGAVVLGCELIDEGVLKKLEKYPVVQCCEYNELIDAPRISIDNRKAAHQAVNYLYDVGHRKIAFIGSTNKCVSSIERLEGYKQALKDKALELNEKYIELADATYSYSSACDVARRLLSLPDRPTAIFAISDVMAMAVVNVAKSMRIEIPEELSVFGCDDIEYARMSNPSISTINQSGYTMGKRAMKMLVDLLNDEYIPEKKQFIEHKILIRNSTGKLADKK